MNTSYLAVTPVYNEKQFINNLLQSITAQTRLPLHWLIIDDGSTDGTDAIIENAAKCYPWIEPLHLPIRRNRAPGGESVVMRHLRSHGWSGYEHIFRIDADVTVQPDYVEALLEEFATDERLGIASGTLYEPAHRGWRRNREPSFQAAGNCRLYSRRCFDAIGGLESGLGWDTIDVTKALMLGFQTRNFEHLPIFHHRLMQTANGRRKGRLNQGEAAYHAGYSSLFMAARALRHGVASPMMSGGVLMMFGYLRCWIKQMPIAAEPDLVKFVRRHQLRRLIGAKTLWR